MSDSSNISLLDALKELIEIIKKNYDDNWITIGKNNCPEMADFGLNTINNSKYDTVIETDSHNFSEIFACVDGNCAMQLGSDIIEVEKGDIVVIPPDVPHTELPKKGHDYIGVWVVALQHSTALHLSGKNSKGFYIVDGCSFDTSHTYITADLINNICNEAKNNYAFNMDFIKTYLLQMLISSVRYIENTANKAWKESVIEEIKKYIHNNYIKQIRLSDLSQAVCISSNYLNTLFKSSTGKTIIQYIEDLRIDKSVNLLKSTDHSIKEIAYRLGYYDQYHFSKMFKKKMKCSPSSFRESIEK